MALQDDLLAGLKAADAAGNTADAQHFADQLKALSSVDAGPRYVLPTAPVVGKQLAADRILEATQGVGLGFGDELAGVIGGLDSIIRGKNSKYGQDTFSGGYNSTVGNARSDLKTYEGQRPLEALGVNAAGSLPLLALGGAGIIGKTGLGARVLDAARTGAEIGGVSGAGYADGDISQRVEGAGLGALAGGALGAALPVVPAAGRVIKNLVTRGVQKPEEFAANYVAKALGNDAIPTADVTAAIKADPSKALINVGNTSTAAAAEQSALSGEGRVSATDFFDSDDAAREGKMVGAVKQLVSDQDLYDQMDKLAAQRTADATPLYKAAYTAPYRRTPKLVDLASRPAVGGAARTAMTRLMNDPDINPDDVRAAMEPVFGSDTDNLSDAQLSQRLTQAMGTRPLEFQVLDYIKRGLDKMAEDPMAPKEIRKLRTAWRTELTGVNPAYQSALNAWAGPSAVMDAMNEGRQFSSMDPEAIERLMGTYGDSEQQAFQAGVARNLQDQASGKTGAVPGQTASLTLSKSIGGNKIMQRRLQAALGSQGANPTVILQRNGWRPQADGTFSNAMKPGQTITLDPNGSWSLEQASKTGKSSSLLNAGADKSTLESVLTGNPVVTKPGPSSVDDLIQLAQDNMDTAAKKNIVIGNSATQRRAEGAKAFDATQEAVKGIQQGAGAVKGGLWSALTHAGSVIGQRALTGLTEARRAAVAKLLFSTDPAENIKALQMIDAIRAGKPPSVAYRPGIVPVISGEIAGQSQSP